MQKKTDKPDPSPAQNDYQIRDPEAFAENMLRFFEQSGSAMAKFLERPDAGVSPLSAASELTNATKTVADLTQRWMANPVKFAESQMQLMQGYAEIWTNTMMRAVGDKPAPVAEPLITDNRFKDPEWGDNIYFDYWKQVYLLTSNWSEELLANTEGLDSESRAKAEFHLRLLFSAMSPSNFPATNPEVWRETFAQNGENFVKGMSMLLSDMDNSNDLLKIRQTDIDAFEVGENLAITPGKVVFQNELIQLIQYTPTTEQVHETPLLIVPPWINKYYILDLTPPKSFVAYAVAQGFTVFIISWVNPDENLAHKNLEDYMIEGVLAAADAVRRETGVEKSNILGYCAGGTLVSTTLAYTAARGEDLFESATLFTTQVDFTNAGDLLMFTSGEQMEGVIQLVDEHGYLDGSRMANVFNMLRPRDLIWPYVVNNYLLGRKPFPFDLLYWNQDSTRMPRDNLKYYLQELYVENNLARDKLKMGGLNLSLSDVKIPVFNLAAREDHIAPAKSCYIGSKLFGGPLDFVVAGSGHIAGVINPPAKVKYQHWTGPLAGSKDYDDWLDKADETPGSWWPMWVQWLTPKSGERREAREPGKVLGVIEDAPGSYVKKKY